MTRKYLRYRPKKARKHLAGFCSTNFFHTTFFGSHTPPCTVKPNFKQRVAYILGGFHQSPGGGGECCAAEDLVPSSRADAHVVTAVRGEVHLRGQHLEVAELLRGAAGGSWGGLRAGRRRQRPRVTRRWTAGGRGLRPAAERARLFWGLPVLSRSAPLRIQRQIMCVALSTMFCMKGHEGGGEGFGCPQMPRKPHIENAKMPRPMNVHRLCTNDDACASVKHTYTSAFPPHDF